MSTTYPPSFPHKKPSIFSRSIFYTGLIFASAIIYEVNYQVELNKKPECAIHVDSNGAVGLRGFR